jgi:hypothetical protein
LLEGRRLLSSGPVVPEEGSDIPSPSRTISKGETKMNTTTLTRSTTIEHRHPIGGSVCFDRLGWSPLWRVEGVELEDGEPVYLLSFGREDRPEHEAGRSEASPVRVEFADGQFRALGLFSGDAKGPYETVVEEPVDVEHKFAVGDKIRGLYGSKTVQAIEPFVMAESGLYPTRVGEPIYRYDSGGFDFVHEIDENPNYEIHVEPVLFPVGTVFKWNGGGGSLLLVTEVHGDKRKFYTVSLDATTYRTAEYLSECATVVSKVVK